MEISSNSVSLAGEFAVLAQLALRGYDANMTLGHTKNVDILVSHSKTKKMYQLEVKTNYRNSRNQPSASKLHGRTLSAWIMNEKHEKIVASNLFYCFVNISKDTSEFKYYIVPSKVVARYVADQHRLWLEADPKHRDQPMRLFRIGLAKERYLIPTPRAEKYENNWTFKNVAH